MIKNIVCDKIHTEGTQRMCTRKCLKEKDCVCVCMCVWTFACFHEPADTCSIPRWWLPVGHRLSCWSLGPSCSIGGQHSHTHTHACTSIHMLVSTDTFTYFSNKSDPFRSPSPCLSAFLCSPNWHTTCARIKYVTWHRHMYRAADCVHIMLHVKSMASCGHDLLQCHNVAGIIFFY